MKILIVEDEQHLADGLRFNLEAEGYECVVAGDGETGAAQLENSKFDAVVLDVMLPGISGFEVATAMREREDYTPVLMLTALDRPADVLQGFEAGADDYLPKPFDLNIFVARVNGLIRRSAWQRDREPVAVKPSSESVNGRAIDFNELTVGFEQDVVHVTLMEAKLLRYLIENEGRAVSRNEILTKVWGLAEDTDTRAIDNFIVRLRRLLGDDTGKPKIVETVRGIGYRFNK